MKSGAAAAALLGPSLVVPRRARGASLPVSVEVSNALLEAVKQVAQRKDQNGFTSDLRTIAAITRMYFAHMTEIGATPILEASLKESRAFQTRLDSRQFNRIRNLAFTQGVPISEEVLRQLREIPQERYKRAEHEFLSYGAAGMNFEVVDAFEKTADAFPMHPALGLDFYDNNLTLPLVWLSEVISLAPDLASTLSYLASVGSLIAFGQ